MKKTAMSEMVAKDMLERLASDEHKALFYGAFASADSKCEESDSCDAHDHHMGDEYEVMLGDEDELSPDTEQMFEVEPMPETERMPDSWKPEWEEELEVAAFDTAVSNLLSASAALDSVGFSKAASASLDLATFVVEAAKKAKKAKKPAKKSEKASDKKSDKASGKSMKSDKGSDKKSDKASGKSMKSDKGSDKGSAKKSDKKSK